MQWKQLTSWGSTRRDREKEHEKAQTESRLELDNVINEMLQENYFFLVKSGIVWMDFIDKYAV